MVKNGYRVIDDFQVQQMRVLVLDSDYEFGKFNKVLIEGRSYSFAPNSIKNWVNIRSKETFKGKTVKFIRED
ncbi:MAG: hypothetical protein IJQ82_07475 [Selenomonadaceae bacterium]|nr:hypothetical protein [Selenomonadaceae bacterium]